MSPSGYLAVDADGHVMEPAEAWADFLPAEYWPVAPQGLRDSQGRRCLSIGGTTWPRPPADPNFKGMPTGGSDPQVRLADMDLEGIGIALLFPTDGLFLSGVDQRDVALALARAYNDWLVHYCSADPARLVHVGALPQADVRDTIEEARRCVQELGSKALMLRPNPVQGRNLDDPAYEVQWEALEELGVPVVMHEGTTLNVPQSGERFENFAFRHACSHPHEQQYALLALACGGVLERHPDLRVVFVEAGCGWLPYWLERLDEHMEKWEFATAPLPLKPSEYFARQCFVTTEPDEKTLPSVVDLVGDDVIMWASDYPHPDGIFPGAVAELADRTDLSDETKRKILRTNALRCFGLPNGSDGVHGSGR
jgi:predicted TIM-barrel fold metal-dependent hydrolase